MITLDLLAGIAPALATTADGFKTPPTTGRCAGSGIGRGIDRKPIPATAPAPTTNAAPMISARALTTDFGSAASPTGRYSRSPRDPRFPSWLVGGGVVGCVA